MLSALPLCDRMTPPRVLEVAVGRTTVEVLAIGPNVAKQFEFLVDTGSTFVGLPYEEIAALGLPVLPGGRHKTVTAMGVTERECYGASMRIDEDAAPAIVVVCPVPVIGYEVLENLRMKVNPVSQSLEKAAEDEIMPPYML